MEWFATLLIALGSGIVSGLVAWGGVRDELRFLHADVAQLRHVADRAHGRIDSLVMEKHHAG